MWNWQAGKRWCASSTSNYQETLEEGKTPQDCTPLETHTLAINHLVANGLADAQRRGEERRGGEDGGIRRDDKSQVVEAVQSTVAERRLYGTE